MEDPRNMDYAPKCPLCGYLAPDDCPHEECIAYEQQMEDVEQEYIDQLIADCEGQELFVDIRQGWL